MSERVPIAMEVNGETVERYIEPRQSLADFLREELELTGTHLGCEMGACGACLVLLNGKAVHSCLMFAVQADGDRVETVEGLSQRKAIADIQTAFHDNNALQCGFCTSGMLVTAYELLNRNAAPSRDDIRDGLSGNYCRCTGYQAIVNSIAEVARARAENPDNLPKTE
jgi:carbon-monoxide dehydrogenase small subunit